MQFNDKVVFVTGGASGIGAQTARDFAKEGAKVVLFDLADGGADVAAEIQNAGGEALFLQGNITKADEVEAAVNQAFETYGDVDYLINSAGVLRDALLVKVTEKDWDFVINVNLKGVFLVTQAIAKRWVATAREKPRDTPITDHKDRRIVSIASMAAEGNIGQTVYSASKAGVIGMTKTWAKELVRYNVRTHAVMPTLIETPILGDLLTKQDGKFEKHYKSRIPFGIGKPEYVSNVIQFLCGDASWFTNGQIVQVNGGKLGDL